MKTRPNLLAAARMIVTSGFTEYRSVYTGSGPTSLPRAKTFESRAVSGFELRDNGEGKQPTLVGYAAVFNSKSQVFYDWREIILPGAFTESLARGDDVRAMIDHDNGRIIGRRSAGTLRLTEDDKGLRVEIDLADTQEARDLVTKIKRKDVSGMSFRFVCLEDKWSTDPSEGGMYIRSVVRCDLIEVSVVAFPAYTDTEVGVRSLDAVKNARLAAATQDIDSRLKIAEAEAKLVGAA